MIPTTRQWSAAAPLPTARLGLAAVALGGNLYALGGQQNGTNLKTVERFDTQANAWSALPAMPQARRNLAATSRENTIYALGGIGNAESSNSVQVFDIVANKWSDGPALVTGASGLGVAAVNGKLYAIGGAKDQLGQIVPHGGIIFTIGEALIVAAARCGLRRRRRAAHPASCGGRLEGGHAARLRQPGRDRGEHDRRGGRRAVRRRRALHVAALARRDSHPSRPRRARRR